MRLLLLAFVFCELLAAQTPAPVVPVPPAPSSFVSELADPSTLVLVSYGVAQVAESTTDWHFTVQGKKYTATPASRAAWAGGLGFGAIALTHYVPKSKRWVQVGTGLVTAYLAGRAYANTLTHGKPVTP